MKQHKDSSKEIKVTENGFIVLINEKDHMFPIIWGDKVAERLVIDW